MECKSLKKRMKSYHLDRWIDLEGIMLNEIRSDRGLILYIMT